MKNVILVVLLIVFSGSFNALLAQDKKDKIVQPEKQFTLENCVNHLDMDQTVKTKVGYQYWFADKDFIDGRTLKMSVVAPNKATHAPHMHAEDEFFFVLEGTARFHLNGETTTGGAYTSFYCPANSVHGISNAGNTELKYLVIKKYQKTASKAK